MQCIGWVIITVPGDPAVIDAFAALCAGVLFLVNEERVIGYASDIYVSKVGDVQDGAKFSRRDGVDVALSHMLEHTVNRIDRDSRIGLSLVNHVTVVIPCRQPVKIEAQDRYSVWHFVDVDDALSATASWFATLVAAVLAWITTVIIHTLIIE